VDVQVDLLQVISQLLSCGDAASYQDASDAEAALLPDAQHGLLPRGVSLLHCSASRLHDHAGCVGLTVQAHRDRRELARVDSRP